MKQRATRLLRLVLKRISRQGDMAIRLRTSTFETILRANGLAWEIRSDEGYREIDAIALEALVVLAQGKTA